MRTFTQTLKFFFLVCALMCTTGVLGGNVTMKVTAESSPATQGYVYVAKSNSAPSSYSLTSDYAEETQYSAYILFYGYTTVSQDFYLFASPKSGYSFKGWSKNSSATSGDTSNPKKVTLSGKESGTVTDGPYYAIFAPADYTVTFDANGGSVTPASKTVTFDATYGTLPAAPNVARAGYTFTGWWTSASGGTQVTSSTTVTTASNHTLYAHWTANNYTVTLESPAATTHGTPSFGVTYDAVTIASITPPSRDKYTFWGYFTGSDSTGTQLIDRYGNVLASVSGYTSDTRKWKYANDLTLYAYLMAKSDQTINWTLTENVEYTTGQAMGATATSGLLITYTSSKADSAYAYINENGRLVVKVPNQTITITASQEGNDFYNAAEPVTKTFVTLGANPNQTTEVHASNITYGQTLSASTLSGDVKLNGIVIPGTLSWVDPSIMPNAGTANHMVLFTPDNTDVYGSIYFEVPVEVDKATPVITWNIGNILREEVRYSHFVESSNKEAELSYRTSSATLLNITTDGVLTTGEVSSKQDGWIKVSQPETDNYYAYNATWSLKLDVTVYPKASICLPIDLTPTNVNAENDFNDANDAQVGSVSWCNTNEKGRRDNYIAWFDVRYTQHQGIALGSWEAGLEGLSVGSILSLIATGKFDYSPKSVDLFFSGIPNTISFDVKSQVVTSSPPNADWEATQKNWHLYVSVDGENFGSPVMSWTGDRDNVSYTFTNDDIRFVRIEYRGNFTGFVKNLRITQKKYLREKDNKTELEFGTETHPLQAPQALTLSYSSLGVCGGKEDAITVTSSNPAFYVDETTITENVGIEQSGEYVVRVRCNDVNQSGTLTFTSNDGTVLNVPVSSTKPAITTKATNIFQTGTEHAPGSGTSYRALRTHDFSDCFNGSPVFDTLYIYGVSESSAADRQWVYDASKGYNVPVVTASNVHTPCFVYKKEGAQYTYARTFDASTKTLNIADSKKCGFVGYRAETPAANAIQVSGANAELYLNNTEIIASGAPLAVNATSKVYANGVNILSSTSNAAVQLSGTTTLSIEDTWTGAATSAILALRPASDYPSIDLGSASGRVDINGTQLELHNAANMAIAHMDGTTEKFDGEVHITDGSIGGEEILGMPKLTFIDGGTFNDGTVVAYTLKGQPKRPRNSRGEIVSRQTMTKTALEAYDWYGQVHLTLDGSAKVNPMLMDEEVWIFNGTNSDHSDDATSWNKESVPGETADVLINAPMVVSGGELKVKSLTINWEDKGKGIPAVTVNPDGGLTVGEGGIDGIKVNMVKNLALKAGAEGATKGQTGFLRIHPNSAEPMPEATVELYTKAYYDMNATDHNEEGKWQFIGYPLTDGANAKKVFPKSWLYNWDAETEEWKNNRKTLSLQPFEGYATSQLTYEEGMLLTFAGPLVQNVDKAINLAYNAGDEFTQNMVANSYSAPIDVTKFEDSDFDNMQSAVYIFNTGSRADIANLGETRTGSCNIPGQYLSIPIGSAAAMKGAFETPTIIAPMQGFCVHATGENAQLRLDYEKLVWNGDYATNKNEPLHINARKQEAEQVNSLCVSLYGEGIADNLYMLESDKYDAAFENGYDAKKMQSGEANIFSVEGDDHLAVDATSSLIGTQIGVRTGDTTAYVLVFTHLNCERPLALLDNETNEIIDINEGTEYTFFAVPNSEVKGRFFIVESANAPTVTTGIGETNDGVKAHKFIKDGQLFILKNGVLYTATGAVVR